MTNTTMTNTTLTNTTMTNMNFSKNRKIEHYDMVQFETTTYSPTSMQKNKSKHNKQTFKQLFSFSSCVSNDSDDNSILKVIDDNIYFTDEQKKKHMIIYVSCNGLNLEHIDKKFKQDFDIVLLAVKNNGMALQYAPFFHNDKIIVKEAIKNNKQAIHFASSELKKIYKRYSFEFSRKTLANYFKNNKVHSMQ